MVGRNTTSLALTVVLAICGPLFALTPAEDAARNPRTVYFTVGDYQDMLYTPLDSPAGIDAAFSVMHDKYRVQRVWWRGGQDEVWGNQFLIRDQSRRYVRLWDWWKDLQYRVVGTNRLAVKAGHDRGMQVWMAYGLFDNGSPADVGFGGFPYAAEDRIRIEHPEWAPINRYGTWRQGGPIEFAYPGARKAMVDYLSKYTIDGGYDGIAFLTYCENHSMHYEDEFGYGQPIVDEFKKRYGIDIRTQPFDHQAWTQLRGEYLTQFMRELHAALAPKGCKIAVSVDGKDPHLPCLWNVAGGVRTVGRLWMDIDIWVKEGIVDEINLFPPFTEDMVATVAKLCDGTKTRVSAFGRIRGDLPAGVDRLMTINTELESGFDWENYIDFPDENVTPQPPEALKSDDVYARRRILTAIQRGKQTATAADVVPLLKDPDIYVRRAALRALAKLDDPSSIPAIAQCVLDPENGVRCQAAIVLGKMGAPNCVKLLLEAVGRDSSTYQFNFVAFPTVLEELKKIARFSDEDAQLLIDATLHNNLKVRETAWIAIKTLALSKAPKLQDACLQCLKSDSDPYCRELALGVLCNVGPNPQVLAAVRDALHNDKDEVVQVRAGTALAGLTRSAGSPPELLRQTIDDLVARFRLYGEGCQRHDKDWGWRETGNALLALGDNGRAALDRIMTLKEDQRLADLAWRVIYLRQEDGFCFVTEEQDRAAHAKHPFLKFDAAASAAEK